jgi:predicted nuclease of predicted toxin-antitoxin system
VKPTLLLDTHLSIALAAALATRGLDVILAKDWQDEDLRNAPDSTILAAATAVGRVVVTRDAKTFPALAGRWTAAGRSHAGLLVLSPRIGNRDIGTQLRSILNAIEDIGDDTWTDRVVYTHQ